MIQKQRQIKKAQEVPTKYFTIAGVFFLVLVLACHHLEVFPTVSLTSLWHCSVSKIDKRDSQKFLDLTVVRVFLGIGVFAVINAAVIIAHHIIQKIQRSQNLYRQMEHMISPF